MVGTTPSIEELNGLGAPGAIEALAPLFEGAPRFLARVVAARPFKSWANLFEAARSIAHEMPEPDQVELIDAHPRLGAPPESVSPLSFREQGYGGDARREVRRDAGRDVAGELERLNDAYEKRFGFRYCVFVAGRSRDELLPELEASLTAERSAELHRALDAVVDIGEARFSKLSGGPR